MRKTPFAGISVMTNSCFSVTGVDDARELRITNCLTTYVPASWILPQSLWPSSPGVYMT